MLRAIGISLLACPFAHAQLTCIFDFDGTLKMPDNKPAKGAKAVVSACGVDNIALASAGGSDDYKRKWLVKYFPSQFSAIVNTPAFESSQPDKSLSIDAILKYYNAETSCSVLFDDSSGNEKYASRSGIKFQQVDSSTGITMRDYSSAMSKLADCSSPKPAPGPCSDTAPDTKRSCAQQKRWGQCDKIWMKGYCCKTCHQCTCGSFMGLNSSASSEQNRSVLT